MAIIEIQPSALPRQDLWSATLRAMAERYAEYRRNRRALAQLRGLDAAALKDLGLDRSELGSVVYGDPEGRRRAR